MIYEDVVCPFCALRCDDLQVESEDSSETASDTKREIPGRSRLSPSCSRFAKKWDLIESASECSPTVDGKQASLGEAVSVARQILERAQAPVVVGMELMGTATHRAAIEYAERSRAVLISSDSVFSRSLTKVIQQFGISTCSLGEIRDRAEVVICWGGQPNRTHPRFWDRVLREQSPQKVVWIGAGKADAGLNTSGTIKVDPEDQFELLTRIRKFLKSDSADGEFLDEAHEANVADEDISRLIELIRSAKSVCVVLGAETALCANPEVVLAELFRLVDELCRHCRCTVFPLTTTGVEIVLTWQTGYSGSVDFGAGFPDDSSPKSFSERLLNHEFDCALVIGQSTLTSLSGAARQLFEDLPRVLLYPISERPEIRGTVEIPIAVDGLNLRDSLFRLDGVLLPGRPLLATVSPSAEDVLQQFLAQPTSGHVTKA